jgi:UDP-glucose 4-epimerase
VAITSGRRVLVTGVSSHLGWRVARRLEADDRVDYLAGVDLREPAPGLQRTEFIRADLNNPLVSKVVESTRVDSILHLAVTAAPSSAGGRSRMKELNVIGTMQLLAGAQKADRLRTLVLKSTTAVYGSNYADPALFREDAVPNAAARSGYAKDTIEIEGYARAFGRRRPDVTLSILRFANFIGPDVDTAFTRYFILPVLPTVLGYDPRVQLVHIDDAVAVTERAVWEGHRGAFNVAGPGILYLSQAIRMAGRPWASVPLPLVRGLAGVMRRARQVDISPEQLPFLLYGRVGDITRLRTQFGYEPRYSTAAAFAEFIDAGVRPLIDRKTAERVGDDLTGLLVGARRTVAALARQEG